MLDALRSNTLRSAEIISAPYQQGLVNAVEDDYNEFGIVQPEWALPKTNDEGNITISDDLDNQSWIGKAFSNVLDLLFGDGSFSERLKNANPADAWRMFHEKRLQADLSSAQTKLEEVTNLLHDLDDADDYVSCIKQYKELENRYNQEISIGTPQEQLMPILQKMDDLKYKMDSFLTKVKTDGKKSETLVDMFYDTDKLWNSKKAILGAVRQNLWVDPNVKGSWYNPLTGLEEFASLVGNVLQSGANAIGKLLPDQIEKSGSFTRRAITQSLPDDDSFDELINDYYQNPYALKAKIDKRREYYNRLQKEKEARVKDIARQYKEGNWLFDPNKISPEYRKLQEENANSGLIGMFIDPTRWAYNFPEMGTSWSDWQSFIGLMATDQAAKWIGKGLVRAGLGANPYVRFALGLGTVASQVGWTAAMRDHETSSEAMDGQSQRVLSRSMDRNADMNKALSEISSYMQASGYDPTRFSDIEKVQMALAYGIKTGEPIFDEEVKESRKGLAQLVNHNNALAAKDYLESFPYMNYTRSFLRDLSLSIGKPSTARAVKNVKKDFQRRLENTTAGSAAERNGRAILDNHIDKVATKISSDLGKRMAFARTAKYLKNNAAKAGYVSFMEGEEEGVQYLTQQRYSRGEYDDYTQSESMFDIPSLFDDLGIGAQATFAYAGFLPGDPNNGDEELKRAMRIGAVTGAMFHGTSALSNFLPSEGRDNLRNFIAQAKNDRIINEIVGRSYGKYEDDQHIAMYFDALSKYGITPSRMEDSLNQLKSVLDENVKPEWVDRDIDLMHKTASEYNNPYLDVMLEALHIDRNSDKHRQLIQTAVHHLMDYENAENDSNDAKRELNMMIDILSELDVDSKRTDKMFGKQNVQNLKEYIQGELEKAKTEQQQEESTWKKLNRIRIEKEMRAQFEAEGVNMDELDEKSVNSAIDKRVNEEFESQLSKEDSKLKQRISNRDQEFAFITDRVKAVLSTEYVNALEHVLNLLKGRKEDLQRLNNEVTGNDARLDRLSGMIDSVDDEYKKERARLDKYKDDKDVKKMQSFKFKNQQDIRNAFIKVILNDAIQNALLPAYQVYTIGRVDPESIHYEGRRKDWKDLSKEERASYSRKYNSQLSEFNNSEEIPESVIEGIYNAENALNAEKNPFDDLVKKQRKEQRRINSLGQEKTLGDLEGIHEIQREAAQRYAMLEFEDVEDRKKVAHREWNAERPLTEEDINRAQNGDKEAQKKVDEQIEVQRIQDLGVTLEPDDEKWDENAGLGQSATGLGGLQANGRPVITVSPSGAKSEDEKRSDIQNDDDKKSQDDANKPQQPVTPKPDEKHAPPKPENEPISLSSLGVTLGRPDGKETPAESEPAAAQEQPSDIPEGNTVPPKTTPEPLEPKDPDDKTDGDTGEQKPGETDGEQNGGGEPLPQTTPNDQDDEEYQPDPVEDFFDDFNEEQAARDAEDMMRLEDEQTGTLEVSDFDYGESTSEEKEQHANHGNVKRDYIKSTFFYAYSTKDQNTPLELKVNGKYVNFGKNKVVKTAAQLAEKLSQRGWFSKVKKYYIVSGNQIDASAPAYCGFDVNTYTISLILEDGNDIYVTTLRNTAPYQNSDMGKTAEGELRFWNVNPVGRQQYQNRLRGALENALTAAAIPFDKSKRANIGYLKDLYVSKFGMSTFDQMEEQIRFEYRNNTTKPIITNDDIRRQVKDLNEFRQQIIDAFCIKDATGRYIIPEASSKVVNKSVSPVNPRISNGTIENARKDGAPVFRPVIGDDAGFGLSDDVEELTKQLNGKSKNPVILGVGRGQFASNEEKYKIAPIFETEQNKNERLHGKGYAGKLYLNVEAPSGGRIPIMLSEQNFKRYRSADGTIKTIEREEDVQLAIDPTTGMIREGMTPCIGEVIYYLMTGRLSAKHMPFGTYQLQSTIAKLIVNNGQDTLLSDKDKARNIPYYILKQLDFDGIEFGIGDLDTPGGLYNRKEIELRNDPIALRHVVYLLSKNFHWNTDKVYMRMTFLDDEEDFRFRTFMEALKDFFTAHPDQKEVKIAGLDELTFSKDDFFKSKGKRLVGKAVSVAAWMMKTGKLQTDLSKQMFVAPYVFASGVKVDNKAKKPVAQTQHAAEVMTDEPVKNGIIDLAEAVAADESLRSQINERLNQVQKRTAESPAKNKAAKLRKDFVTQAIEEARKIFASVDKKKETLDNLNKKLNREEKPYKEIFLIDTSEFKEFSGNKKQLAERSIRARVKDALHRVNIQFTDSDLDDKLRNYTEKSSLDLLRQVIDGESVIQLRVWDDQGKANWNITPIKTEYITNPNQFLPITGVFSTFKNKGRLNAERAKEWLHQTLGIDPNNVYVTNGILRGCNDEIVYGAMNASIDALGKVTGNFTLSSAEGSGRGVHFHEAWHFINLLIHTKEERTALYKLYLEQHPELNKPTTSFKDIEEAMAEDFRKYAEMRTGLGLHNKIKRFFNSVLQFIGIGNRKDMLRMVFDSIMNGEYAKMKIDTKSYYEFVKRFPKGINKAEWYVDGVRQDKLDKLQGISSYQEFYETGEALAHMMLDQFGFLRTGNINKKLTGEKYKELMYNIKAMRDEATGKQALVLQDIIDNVGIFNAIIKDVFGRYGIELGFRKNKKYRLTKEEIANNPDQKERIDEIAAYEIEDLKVSKKDNVGYKAKLFLSQLVKTRFEYDDNGERTVVQDGFDILNCPKYISFDEAWYKIVDKLHDVRSYDKTGENGYDNASILGRVEKEAETDPFFYSLLMKLQYIEEDDVELQTQIFGTIASQKSKIAFFELRDPVVQSWMEDEMDDMIDDQLEDLGIESKDIVADRVRNWILQHDTTIRARRNLPRTWGQILVTSGFVRGGVIDANFALSIKNDYDAIKLLANQTPTSDQYRQAYIKLSREWVKLLNKMAIPADMDVIEQYIANMSEYAQDYESKYKNLKNAVLNTGDGSIGGFVNYINQNVGKSELPIGNSQKTKPLSNIYTGYEKNNAALPQISDLAVAHHQTHPASSEFSMTAPDGSRIYPICQNNTVSDLALRLSINEDNLVDRMMESQYGANSIILKLLRDLHETGEYTNDDKIELVSLVGLKDSKKRVGKDYFGITPLEDFIIKMNMTMRDMLVLPTMADKKTYYTLRMKRLKLSHDLITYNDVLDNEGQVKHRGLRFSDATLKRFFNYFLDEYNSLLQYYDKDNIAALVNGEAKAIENYHGNIYTTESGQRRMDFSGNGGKFRYMYDILPMRVGKNVLNLNQQLEYIYEKQKIEESIGEASKYGDNRDGFEAVREFLEDLKHSIDEPELLYDAINDNLIRMTFADMDEMSKEGALKILEKYQVDGQDRYESIAIPSDVLNSYKDMFQKGGVMSTMVDVYQDRYSAENFVLSAMANNTINTMTSIIEFEKIFSGDPACYKWKNQKESTLVQFNIDDKPYTVSVHDIRDAHADKIKRLGGVLSPGQNLRTDYSKEAAAKYKDADLKNTKYTTLTVNDINTSSQHVPFVRHMFLRQAFIDHIMTHKPDVSMDYINKLYQDKFFGQEWDKFKKVDPAAVKAINSRVANQINPYNIEDLNEDDGITVSDAQVVIRPSLYRKIRISLGQWTDDDENAYWILETSPDWMNDPELSKKVHMLQLFPLKMSYFQNSPYSISSGNTINRPIYNKMAIFPLFKFQASATSGSQLYERMNRAGEEIDMVLFSSAVKVGANKKKYSPYEKNAADLSKLQDGLDASSEELGVMIQELTNLRMQLNTEAHLDFERSIGTQMFKLAFSNVFDKLTYGENKPWVKNMTGADIKADIMRCVKALTKVGANGVMAELYDGTGENADKRKVRELMTRIAQNNDVGLQAEEILRTYGSVASLASRKLFEHGVSALVNKEVVNINTIGGSAIQQSLFGFTGYDKENIDSQFDVDEQGNKVGDNKYHTYNNGEELNWNLPDGSMEVLLSENFFRSVVPTNIWNKGYTARRQWLIDHNIIKGTKTDGTAAKTTPFGVGYRIPTQGMSSIFAFTVADILQEQVGDVIVVPREFTAQTGSDFDVDKIFLSTMAYIDGQIAKISSAQLDAYLKGIPVRRRPEEALEYAETAIANQGIADQDVDPMQLVEMWNEKQILDNDYISAAIANRLLLRYMQIISDQKTYADARASIDTITKKIQKELLPYVRDTQKGYQPAMYDLLPSFQARTKMEFYIGKQGIGPFALNVTNMALTQAMHLVMRYSNNNQFGFLDMDSVLGKDGERISAWLSAMVNAHVDVAKDPYIFAINVNKATYNHVNFLLRAGMGMSTFTFIAQPCLKEYAQVVTTSGGIYGSNIKGEIDEAENVYVKTNAKRKIKKALEEKMKEALSLTVFENQDQLTNWNNAVNGILSKPSEAVSPYPEKFKTPWEYVMDVEEGMKSLKYKDSLQSLYFQYVTMLAFDKINVYAEEMSNLVQLSQIDTKKFGNDVPSHINFINRYEQFKNSTRQVTWYISSDITQKNSSPNNSYTAQQLKEINQVLKDKGKTYALRKYFHDSFLDDKLYTATNLTRNILRSQTFTATDHFRTIMTTVFRILNGPVEWNVPGKKYPVPGYNPVLRQDSVDSMAQAIDNIMRFRVLLNTKTKKGGVNFNMDRDLGKIYKNYRRLLYGYSDQDMKDLEVEMANDKSLSDHDRTVYREHYRNSIFSNLSAIKEFVQKNPNNPILGGIVNGYGEITNEFLAFIFPQAPSQEFPVGRILLARNQMEVDVQQKSVLRSAFDQLFRSPSLRIRLLAEDLALFAYYSTFDANTTNSFFDLVPTPRRTQYDEALSKALNDLSDAQLGHVLSPKTTDFFSDFRNTDNATAEEFLEIICRNYWYDDNVVKRVYYTSRNIPSVQDVVNSDRDFYGQVNFNTNVVGNRFVHGIIVTSNFKDKYVKVEEGGQFYLYKRVGFIRYRSAAQDNSTPLSVYKLIPKLGIHRGSNHYYEFFSGSEYGSVFEENRLDSAFASQDRKGIDATQFAAWLSQQKYTTEQGEVCELYFEPDQVVSTPITWTQTASNLGGNLQQLMRSDDGVVRFDGLFKGTSGESYIQRQTDIQVDIDPSKSFDQLYSELKSKIGDEFKERGINIGVSGNLTAKISNSEFEEYKNLQIQSEKERLIAENGESMNENVLQQKLDTFASTQSANMYAQLQYIKTADLLQDLFSRLILEGYRIKQFYTIHDGKFSLALASAVKALKPYMFDNFVRSANGNTIVNGTVDGLHVAYERDQFKDLSDYSNLKNMYSGESLSKTISPEQQQVLANISAQLTELYTQFTNLSEQAEQAKAKEAAAVQKAAEESAKNSNQNGGISSILGSNSQKDDLESIKAELDDVDDILGEC